MHELYELKDKLIKELEAYSQNGKFSREDVEAIKYMASAVDHLCNIVGESEYSQRGNNSRNYGYAYERSYARNQRRDTMGRYSRTEGVEELVDSVRGMMQDLPPHLKQDAQRFIQKLEQEM